MTQVPPDAAPALNVLRSVGGDEMIAMMMETFVRFAEERVAKLDEELRNGRLAEVAGIAHSLKSSALQLGAMALGTACAATEEAARGGNALPTGDGVRAIHAAFDAARPWMSALAKGSS